MNYVNTANKYLQGLLDRSVPYKRERWAALLLSAYVLYRILIYDFLAIGFRGLYVDTCSFSSSRPLACRILTRTYSKPFLPRV